MRTGHVNSICTVSITVDFSELKPFVLHDRDLPNTNSQACALKRKMEVREALAK